MNRLKKITALLLAVMMCLGFCSCTEKEEKPEDQIILYRVDSEPDTLDPQIANDASAQLIIMNIFEGLVRLDENNDAVPGAAESWEISGDDLMYTFHLRENLKWNDGSALTAEDFVYGIRRAVQPQTASPTASTLFCIKNAESINKGKSDIDMLGVFAHDDNTLVIQLEYPDSDLLNLLATPPAMPCSKAFFEKAAGQYGRTDEKILSNGAFYIREDGWAHDEYVYLRKNENYVGKDQPIPAGVNITIGETDTDICNAISSGETDCGAVSAAQANQAEKLGFHLKGFGDTIWGISFNTKDTVLQNSKIRNSLLSALDRDFILKELPENCTSSANIIPDSAELDGKQYRKLAGNVTYVPSEKAAKLLAEGLEESELTTLSKITIVCSGDEKTQSFVNNIIQTWNDFTGGYFNKKPVALSELKDTAAGENYQIIIAPLTIQGNTPLSTLELFESTSRYNTASLISGTYDNFVGQIRTNLTAESAGTIKEAERYLLDEGIFYPLYVENRYYASAGNVTGIIFHPYGAEVDFFYAKKIV